MYIKLKELLFIPIYIIVSYQQIYAESVHEEIWYINAYNYVSTKESLFSHEKTIDKIYDELGADTDEIYVIIDDISEKFASVKQPSPDQIGNLINSDLSENIITACAAIKLSREYSEIIVEQLAKKVKSSKSSDIRYQCISALKEIAKLNPQLVKKYEKHIVDAIKTEKNNDILLDKLIILGYIRPLSEYGSSVMKNIILKNDSNLVMSLAFSLLNEHYPDKAKQVLSKLEKQDVDYVNLAMLKAHEKGKYRLLYFLKETKYKDIKPNYDYKSQYCTYALFDLISNSY